MQVIVSKDIQIYDPTDELLGWIANNMILDNPLYKQMKIMGKDDVIRRTHIPEKITLYTDRRGVITLPSGTLYGIWPMIKGHEIDTFFNNNSPLSYINDEPTFPLYDYQEQAVQTMIKAKSGILVAPCRSGKTFCGVELVKRIGKKTLWLCHTGDLLRQAKEDFLKVYPNAKIGLTTKGKLEIGEDITISTVQTLSTIQPYYYEDEFDVVIVDECHHCVSNPTQMKMFGKVISNIKARYKYGLTATPNRNDGMTRSMYSYIGMAPSGKFEPVYQIKKDEVKKIDAIHQRFEINSGYDGENIYQLYDSSGMMNYNKLLEVLTTNEKRTDKIVDNIVKCYQEKRKQVVLSHRVEHCKVIVDKLQQKGVNAVLCTGGVKEATRKAIINQEVDWDVLVATNALLKEGVTINELDTLHLVTPFKDGNMATQCVGRIEGYLENKNQPIAYDYVDVDIPYCEKRFSDRRRALKKR